MRVLQHVRRPWPGSQPNLRDSGHSAPTQSDRMRQNTREPGADAGDLLDLGLAVDREEADAERVGARDVALLLDGVAVGDAVGRGAGREHHLDLGDRGGVEAGAELGQQRQHLRRRVGLHGVEHAGVGQRLGKGRVVVAHDVEIDDEAGPVLDPRSAQEFTDALGHCAHLPSSVGGAPPHGDAWFSSLAPARDGGRADASNSSTAIAALAWMGRPRTALLAKMDKPLR